MTSDTFAWRHLADKLEGIRLPTTRLRALHPWAAVLLLAATVALMIGGAMPLRGPAIVPIDAPTRAPAGRGADLTLYQAIETRIAAGQDYYSAAITEQRARHFPLRPFVTVRLPTVATINGRLGTVGGAAVLAVLAFAAAIALVVRLHAALGFGRTWLAAAMIAAIAIGPIGIAESAFHEPWAAVLITLSLALRSRRHWGASLLLGVAAVAARELAAPYLVVMAATAALEGARREALSWIGAGVVAALLIGLHAHAVAALVRPTDLASPGWQAFGGWPFVLRIVHEFTSLSILPATLSNLLVPLALLGWAGLRGPLGLRGALLLGGYAGLFMLFGRPDNTYWGVMLAPLMPIGLVLAPASMTDLATSIWREPAIRAVDASQAATSPGA